MNAEQWAKRLIADLDEGQREALGRAPAVAIQEHFSPLQVEAVLAGRAGTRARGAGGLWDGLSFLGLDLIAYVVTGNRRGNFTLLHELGHWLVDRTWRAKAWTQDEPNPQRAEEEICDHVAAHLLLPPDLVDAVLEAHKPRAHHLFMLHDVSEASRPVCAIALGRRLGCDGFVAVIERENWTVSFATRNGDPRPHAWRGDAVPVASPLRELAQGGRLTRVATWPYSGRRGTAQFCMDAMSDDRYICALFAKQNLWAIPGVLALEDDEPPLLPDARSFRCPTCRTNRVAWPLPCDDCHQLKCRTCNQCGCDRQRALEAVCTGGCNIRYARRLLDAEGRSTSCRARAGIRPSRPNR